MLFQIFGPKCLLGIDALRVVLILFVLFVALCAVVVVSMGGWLGSLICVRLCLCNLLE